jgi:hypothetical protein
MPTIQILAIALGVVVAGAVFLRSWQPEAWWFNSVEAFLKAGVAFVAVVGAIWLVTLVPWDRAGSGDGEAMTQAVYRVTTFPDSSPTPVPIPKATPVHPTPTEAVPTPTPAIVPRDSGRTEMYLDLGGCDSQPSAPAGECEGEAGATFIGWGSAQGPWSGMPFAPGGDCTLRDMSLGGDNLIIFEGLASVDFLLTVVTGDGACDDSFQILIEDQMVYEYHARDPQVQTFETHQVSIPSGAIEDGQLTITFRNTARDGCGLAGVFNVMLWAV